MLAPFVNKIMSFDSLPREVLCKFFLFLSAKERLGIQRVSKEVNECVIASMKTVKRVEFVQTGDKYHNVNICEVKNMQQVNAILRLCRHVKQVYFDNIHMEQGSEDLRETSVLIADCTRFTFTKHITSLDVLSLYLLTQRLTSLEELTLIGSNATLFLDSILRRNSNLKVLRLNNLPTFVDGGLLPPLREFTVKNGAPLLNIWHSLFTKSEASLEILDVNFDYLGSTAHIICEYISSFANLKCLRVNINVNYLRFLTIRPVKCLDIKITSGNFRETIIYCRASLRDIIWYNERLHSLILKNVVVDYKFVSELCETCTNVKYLSLDIAYVDVDISWGILESLLTLSKLEGLDVITSQFKHCHVAEFVRDSHSLRGLKVGIEYGCCQKIIDAFVEKANANRNIRHYLIAESSQITNFIGKNFFAYSNPSYQKSSTAESRLIDDLWRDEFIVSLK